MFELPQIIYTTSRTKSNATTQAAKKPCKLYEPFELYKFYGNEYRKVLPFLAAHNNRIIETQWPTLISQLNSSDTISKIFSTGLASFLPAARWFREADSTASHTIFVLVRPLKDILWSNIIAKIFGYLKDDESNLEVKIVPDENMRTARLEIELFLRFFPKNATLITFETLPLEHFDYSYIRSKNQNTHEKRAQFSNFEFVEYHVNQMISYFKDEWNEKLLSIPATERLDNIEHLLIN